MPGTCPAELSGGALVAVSKGSEGVVDPAMVTSGGGSALVADAEQPARIKARKSSETKGNLTFIFGPSPVKSTMEANRPC